MQSEFRGYRQVVSGIASATADDEKVVVRRRDRGRIFSLRRHGAAGDEFPELKWLR